MRDDPETDFYRAWNAGQVSRVSDGEIMKPTINNQRQWVGLEAEDLAQIESDEFWQVGNHMAIAMAVEAKLKERNSD